ncbi:hypothetical protein BCR44DRAFT_1437477 [Catenaria anguillulae PL171]|uniref:Uncharacterized protein n=1 Tax=Catenaria anguillulae PL171 TaxID=765915 RepID=A0A1Y2HKT9_9FUNG|nr:hypothetical protein BCR44DRAFT_1437477 [Catenaria anguillulae PL171]
MMDTLPAIAVADSDGQNSGSLDTGESEGSSAAPTGFGTDGESSRKRGADSRLPSLPPVRRPLLDAIDDLRDDGLEPELAVASDTSSLLPLLACRTGASLAVTSFSRPPSVMSPPKESAAAAAASAACSLAACSLAFFRAFLLRGCVEVWGALGTDVVTD